MRQRSSRLERLPNRPSPRRAGSVRKPCASSRARRCGNSGHRGASRAIDRIEYAVAAVMLGPDDPLLDAAQRGDVDQLSALLDDHPDKLHARATPYEWSLLHFAAQKGHVGVVDLLLRRGLDVNTREKGDNTYAMHWAAASGHLDVVRRLADAGGDVIGHGDDHQLEVIGWGTGWDGCDDATHRAIADFLVSRGARHHIYSAIALNLA